MGLVKTGGETVTRFLSWVDTKPCYYEQDVESCCYGHLRIPQVSSPFCHPLTGVIVIRMTEPTTCSFVGETLSVETDSQQLT